jgi:hypothetical protein
MRENVQRLCPELWWHRNVLLHHGNAPSHISFWTRNCFTKNNIIVVPTHPTFLCFPDWRKNRVAAIFTQLSWSRQNRRRCWTPSQNTTSRKHLKMVEALGMVHARGRGPLRRL